MLELSFGDWARHECLSDGLLLAWKAMGEEHSPEAAISFRVAAENVKFEEAPGEVTDAGSPEMCLEIAVPVVDSETA
jgi:hypothetical protein